MKTSLDLLVLLSLSLAAIIRAETNDSLARVLAPEATVQKLAGGFKFTEGPTSDASGNVYFTDQPNDRIMKWSVDGQLTTFLQPAGRANGMCFDRQGRLIACADETNALWRIDVDRRTVTVLAWQYEGRPLNGPNDVWVAPNGDLYFTDPYYQRPWWKHKEPPQPGQHVYRLSADGQRLTRVADDLQQPNGITGSPDGKTLYVADIRAGRPPGCAHRARGHRPTKAPFSGAGGEGMQCAAPENLYAPGRGVRVSARTGKRLGTPEVPENWTANVAFGGPDRRTLFITASTGLYSIRTRFPGANPGK